MNEIFEYKKLTNSLTKGADIDSIRPATEMVPIPLLLKAVTSISAANTYNIVNDVFLQNLPIITRMTLKEDSIVKVIIAKNTTLKFKKKFQIFLSWITKNLNPNS